MVLYQEKLYAAGKIPGGFLRREGKASERETLVSRLIDRPIRPLFADGFNNEVQVINTVLSSDPDCSTAMAAMLGSSIVFPSSINWVLSSSQLTIFTGLYFIGSVSSTTTSGASSTT